MKKLALLAIIAAFSANSALAAGSNRVAHCFGVLPGTAHGYTADVYKDPSGEYTAILSKYFVDGSPAQQLEQYDVTQVLPGDPGSPLSYVTASLNFTLNICTSCAPVDGYSPGQLSATTDEGPIPSLQVFCKVATT